MLQVDGVSKRYGRRGPWALDELSCHFPSGRVCALVGPNGAGKTTLFSVIAGYLRPDRGVVSLFGEGPFDALKHKGRVGILPQDAALNLELTCVELLTYHGHLQGIPTAQLSDAIDRALREVNLVERSRDRVRELSHGMRRRLSAASALLGAPELVLLDEPTAGLDPKEARHLRDVLTARRGGTTVIISSHNLLELEQLCDHVVILSSGRCVREGSVDELTRRGQNVRWTLGPGDVPMERLRELLSAHELNLDGAVLSQVAPADEDLDTSAVVVARELAVAGVAIRGVERGEGLEDAFLAEVS